MKTTLDEKQIAELDKAMDLLHEAQTMILELQVQVEEKEETKESELLFTMFGLIEDCKNLSLDSNNNYGKLEEMLWVRK